MWLWNWWWWPLQESGHEVDLPHTMSAHAYTRVYVQTDENGVRCVTWLTLLYKIYFLVLILYHSLCHCGGSWVNGSGLNVLFL